MILSEKYLKICEEGQKSRVFVPSKTGLRTTLFLWQQPSQYTEFIYFSHGIIGFAPWGGAGYPPLAPGLSLSEPVASVWFEKPKFFHQNLALVVTLI